MRGRAGLRPVGIALWLSLVAASACTEAPRPLPVPRPVPSPAPACDRTTVAPAEFRFGVLASVVRSVPDLDDLGSWIGARIGIPARVEVLDRYEDLGSRMLQGTLEAAMLPPLEYIRTHDRNPCIAARLTSVVGGSVRYSSFLVARKDSRIRRLEDLRGARGAFVSPDSASGWLFAWRRLQEAGMDPWKDLAEVRFVGSHAAVIEAVLEGKSDVGATFDAAIVAAQQVGWDTASLSLVALGGRIPYDAVVVSPEVPAPLAESFLQALSVLDTTTPEGRRVLAALVHYDGFVPTDDSFYDDVRRVAESVLMDSGRTR
ncbi:MAG TPA: PhnD/SsuA/transferrin family substrate-binding protein [Myxococcota bacterium]|nr:PhnD/SsuA/transferrin family substrate-binding protein [Myxococcota bacterium]HQK50955.1 PhnD/SsuA/transferrin family substrate-binding protein [Myxococcota bacterium]